ncbi:hypothetical protein B0H13DRAFT_2412865 [Mycena leptocephala]|nr:hypothetical protein B0H13DRAFT_2412865 [Mycena leptocephala]
MRVQQAPLDVNGVGRRMRPRVFRCTQATPTLVRAICGAASCGLAPSRLDPDTCYSHAARCFRRSCLDLYLDVAMRVRPLPSASTPMPKRSPPHPIAPGLTGQMLKEAPPPPAPYFTSSSAPRFVVRGAVLYPQFELILRPRSDRAFNDASIHPRRSPTPTQRGPLRTSSSGVVTDTNTEYTLSNDAGSPLDWPSYRARRPPVPPRLDLSPATSQGECTFLVSTRSIPSTPLSAARPRILRVVLPVAISSGCLAGPGPARLRADAPDTQRLTDVVDTVRLRHLQSVETVACPRSLAHPLRLLSLLLLHVRLLAPPQFSWRRTRRLAFTSLRRA